MLSNTELCRLFYPGLSGECGMKKIIASKHSTDCVNCGMILLSYDVRLVDGNMHYCLKCAEMHHAGKERRTYKADSALNIIRGMIELYERFIKGGSK